MLIPALSRKEEILRKFQALRYTEKIMYYNGCLEQGEITISEDDTLGRYQYAICDDNNNVVGYIGYWLDFYSSCAWSFGLISFDDKPNRYIGLAILEVINSLKKMDIRRIEFGAVSGNPAVEFYDKLTKKFFSSGLYSLRKFIKLRTFKDAYGNYHNSLIYEIIKWDSITEKVATLDSISIRKTLAYQFGYDDGHEDGHVKGYITGFEDGKQKILQELSDGE